MDGLGLHPAPPPRSPLSARAFGPEVLLGELIGRGGMSRVYRGWLRSDGTEVAVKILRDDLAGHPDAVQRFIRERDLLAAVASPHVVRVHDLVVDGDEVGIVMDLVAGGHLRRAVEFPCPPHQAALLTEQIADGLAAVHETGVIHRDLKPENVLVDSDGEGGVLLRLTDFGISRLVEAGTLTQTTVTGTPGYLPPEVAGGGKVTAAADVYALGVVLYELCAGRGPFVADNPLVLILAATRQEAPRPGSMPDDLWDLLSAMLAKDPLARPTAAHVAARLRAMSPALAGLPACTPPPPPTVTETPPAGGRYEQQHDAAQPGQPAPADGQPAARGDYVLLSGPPSVPLSRPGNPPGTGPGGTGRPGRRLGLLVTSLVAIAAVGLLVAFGMLGPGRFIGRGGEEVLPRLSTAPPGPTTSGPPTFGPTGPASSGAVVVVTAPGHPSSPTTTGSGPTRGGTGTTGPGAGPRPGVPTLTDGSATDAERHSSDGLARLAIGGVSPGAGTVSSITIRYRIAGATGAAGATSTKTVDVVSGATSYPAVVEGLTNGKTYTFTVEVCASANASTNAATNAAATASTTAGTTLCTTSLPYTFTPYTVPEVVAPVLALDRSGIGVNVTVEPVVRNSNPGPTVCTVTVSPSEPDGPKTRDVDPDGDTFTFVGAPSTTYTASQSCTTYGQSDGTPVTSKSVTTAATPVTDPTATTTPAAAAARAG